MSEIEIGYFDRDEMKEMCDRFNVNIDDIVPEDVTTIQPVQLQSDIQEYLFLQIQQSL